MQLPYGHGVDADCRCLAAVLATLQLLLAVLGLSVAVQPGRHLAV
jgi:hypothetical protein